MFNTTEGVVTDINDTTVSIEVDRKGACHGCQAEGICHMFTSPVMKFNLPRPSFPLNVGDKVTIAIQPTSLVWASIVTYIIPVVAIFLAMGITHQYGLDVGVQATTALIAFLASLALVRWIGKSFKGPKIIEK
ncbi:MAG: SoxR reducing system RseC family protein [Deltaproteobacteria bacterium]|nr:SoxR reducing system RseC family protein [Deltaproteobacteria bacterium]